MELFIKEIDPNSDVVFEEEDVFPQEFVSVVPVKKYSNKEIKESYESLDSYSKTLENVEPLKKFSNGLSNTLNYYFKELDIKVFSSDKTLKEFNELVGKLKSTQNSNIEKFAIARDKMITQCISDLEDDSLIIKDLLDKVEKSVIPLNELKSTNNSFKVIVESSKKVNSINLDVPLDIDQEIVKAKKIYEEFLKISFLDFDQYDDIDQFMKLCKTISKKVDQIPFAINHIVEENEKLISLKVTQLNTLETVFLERKQLIEQKKSRFQELEKFAGQRVELCEQYGKWIKELTDKREDAELAKFKMGLGKFSHMKSELQVNLNKLVKEIRDLSHSNSFQGALSSFRNHKDIFPKIAIQFGEVDPVRKILDTYQYQTFDLSEYTIEKEITPRVVQVKKGDIKFVLKRFNVDTQKSLLKHALEISTKFADNPYLLNIFGICTDISKMNNIMYLEYPYYQDGSIEDWCKSEKFNLAKLGSIFYQIAVGLKQLHTYKILHRDIKPANVLIQQDKIVLADFDVCQFKEYSIGNPTAHTTSVGGPYTPGFVAPEVVRDGNSFSYASDIYALGITFISIFNKCDIITQSIGQLSSWTKSMPDELKELVIAMVEHSPSKRPSIQNVLLNKYLGGSYDCPICCNTMKLHHGMICPSSVGIEHFICTSCFSGYVEARCESNTVTDQGIKCPFNKCSYTYSMRDIEVNCSLEITNLFHEQITWQQVQKANALANKDATEVYEEKIKQFDKYVKARMDYLEENRPEAKEKLLNYLLGEQALENDPNIRCCPRCSRVIIRTEGCQIMVCGRDGHLSKKIIGCGHEFHWNNEAKRYKSPIKDLAKQIKKLTESAKRIGVRIYKKCHINGIPVVVELIRPKDAQHIAISSNAYRTDKAFVNKIFEISNRQLVDSSFTVAYSLYDRTFPYQVGQQVVARGVSSSAGIYYYQTKHEAMNH